MRATKRGLVKNSTRNFYLEGKKTKNYSLYDFLHGYLYAKWPYLYISVALGEHRLTKTLTPLFLFLSSIFGGENGDPDQDPEYAWANSYHGKVVPLEEAQNLVTIREDIELRNLEHVIPFTRAKDIVMINPDRIVALDCPCRLSREDPCTPVDVCLIVGDPFASFILDHQPEKSRLISSEEAIEILKAEHDQGHVSHAFFKDAMLERFYAICNCCSCCCGAFQSHQNGTPMLMSSGYTARVNSDLCEGCGICEEFCQFSAIKMIEGWCVTCDIQEECKDFEIVGKRAFINRATCFGCGVCVDKCAHDAIQLNLDPSKGEPLEILTLMEEARQSV